MILQCHSTSVKLIRNGNTIFNLKTESGIYIKITLRIDPRVFNNDLNRVL